MRRLPRFVALATSFEGVVHAPNRSKHPRPAAWLRRCATSPELERERLLTVLALCLPSRRLRRARGRGGRLGEHQRPQRTLGGAVLRRGALQSGNRVVHGARRRIEARDLVVLVAVFLAAHDAEPRERRGGLPDRERRL